MPHRGQANRGARQNRTCQRSDDDLTVPFKPRGGDRPTCHTGVSPHLPSGAELAVRARSGAVAPGEQEAAYFRGRYCPGLAPLDPSLDLGWPKPLSGDGHRLASVQLFTEWFFPCDLRPGRHVLARLDHLGGPQ
jgi:hypothetical protein